MPCTVGALKVWINKHVCNSCLKCKTEVLNVCRNCRPSLQHTVIILYYFFPQTSKQYELINYSEHGTYVDNVLYSCDFSDKINRHVVSSKDLDPSKVSKNKLLAAAQVRQNSKPKGSRRTVGLGVQKIVKACNCTTSSSNLIGGSGAGWEGTALLHHGSYIKLGCAQFVFSITSQATKLPSSGKASSSCSSEKKPVVSWWMLRFFGLCGFYMCDVHPQLQMEFMFHHSIRLTWPFVVTGILKKKMVS